MDELVRCLRHCADAPEHRGCGANCNYGKEHPWNYLCIPAMMQEAADAIEELSAFREQITDGHFYCMRDGVLYEAKVEPPKGKVYQLPPIEFAEEGE